MSESTDRWSRFSWRGLTPQLFIIIILPLTVLLLAVTFGGLRLHQLSMRGLVGERDTRAARAAASALADQVVHRQTALRSLALVSAEQASPEQLDQHLAQFGFLGEYFDYGLAFYSLEGALLAYQGEAVFWSALALPTLLQQGALSGMQPEDDILLTVSHPQEGIPLMLAVSATAQGDRLAVGAFSPANLLQSDLAELFGKDEGGFAFVIDQQHRVLYSLGKPASAGEDLAEHAGVEQALAGESGATHIQTMGSEHVVAYSPIEPVGWALVIEEPWEVVASPILRATEYAPLVLIPILLLALVAIWFGARRIVQPLRELEARASALGWGNYGAISEPVGGVEEIRQLQTELVHLAQKVRAAQQGLRDYIGAMTRGQEEERRRLARELHDDTLQSLIALNQRIQLARMEIVGDEDHQILEEIQQLTGQTIKDLRRVTRALRPVYLEDLGLVPALEVLARESEISSRLPVKFTRQGDEVRLQPEVELAIYRMAQEALSNAIRHARASKISLSIAFENGEVTMQVSDDGLGFAVPESPAGFAPSGHFGLLGLHERAELIGARLAIRSDPGLGTRVKVILPMPKQQSAVSSQRSAGNLNTDG